MKGSSFKSGRPKKGISAADVGRFLRQYAAVIKDVRTGNPDMAEALLNLSLVLLDEKYSTPTAAAQRFMDQGGFNFDDDIDFSNVSVEEVRRVLSGENITRAHLAIIGVERFGIARSRLEKLPRDEIIRLITAAIQHEESLGIIAEEARRGGQNRSS